MSPFKRNPDLRKLVEKTHPVFDSKELNSKKIRQAYVELISADIKKLNIEIVSHECFKSYTKNNTND